MPMSMLMIVWGVGGSCWQGRRGGDRLRRSCWSREVRIGLVPLELMPVAVAMALREESLQVLSQERGDAIHGGVRMWCVQWWMVICLWT